MLVGIVILIVIALILSFIVISEKIFEGTNYYKKHYTETDKLKDEDKVDYVNTGSTFAFFGLDYQSINVKGLNLALCPQSLDSDFKMLKHFETRYNPGATVFIVISDMAFAKKAYEKSITTDKYYKVLNKSEITDYNSFKAIRAKYFPVFYNWKNFFRFYRDIKPDNEYFLKVNENDREAVEADAFTRCEAWKKEFSLENLSDRDQSKRFKEVFAYTTDIVKQMINWCKEKGFNPVIVNLPMTAQMEQNFSEGFLDAFYYRLINEIVSENGIKFIDMQKKKKLDDYLLYLDSCRLNASGRRIITRILLNEIGN